MNIKIIKFALLINCLVLSPTKLQDLNKVQCQELSNIGYTDVSMYNHSAFAKKNFNHSDVYKTLIQSGSYVTKKASFNNHNGQIGLSFEFFTYLISGHWVNENGSYEQSFAILNHESSVVTDVVVPFANVVYGTHSAPLYRRSYIQGDPTIYYYFGPEGRSWSNNFTIQYTSSEYQYSYSLITTGEDKYSPLDGSGSPIGFAKKLWCTYSRKYYVFDIDIEPRNGTFTASDGFSYSYTGSTVTNTVSNGYETCSTNFYRN